jgi:hypothetical protein
MKFNKSRIVFIKISTILILFFCNMMNSQFLKENSDTNSYTTNYENNSEIETKIKSNVKMHITTIAPKYVQKLSSQKKIESIQAEPEVESDSKRREYYDGSVNMKINNSECEVYSLRPFDCIKNSHCGWCEDSKKCVTGGRGGASSGFCRKENFVYFMPGRDWDPLGQRNGNLDENNYDENVTFY